MIKFFAHVCIPYYKYLTYLPVLFLTVLLLSGNVALAQNNRLSCHITDPHNVSREQWADFESVHINLRFEPEKGLVKGEVTLKFTLLSERADSLWLDGVRINVLAAELDSVEVGFYAGTKKVAIVPSAKLDSGSLHILHISYEATPRKGMFFVGWQDTSQLSRKQIWTQGQGIDNRHWFPHWDDLSDKLKTETTITFDSSYTVISNGQLLSRSDNGDGTHTWHYALNEPHASYLVMVAIGKYNSFSETNDNGLITNLFYYPEWKNRAEATYEHTRSMTEYITHRVSVPYPWGTTYSEVPVKDYMHGAMENTSAIIFRDDFLATKRGAIELDYTGVDAHEFAHQWFGNYITARYPADHWLHESFATYYQLQWLEEHYGTSFLEETLDTYSKSIFAASLRDTFPVGYSRAGVERQYFKGAWVLVMLEDLIGRHRFDKIMTDYLDEFAYQNVSTASFFHFVNSKLDYDISWFWDQWICHPGEPEISANFQVLQGENGEGRLDFKLSQNKDKSGGHLFRLPLKVALSFEDGTVLSETYLLETNELQAGFRIPAGAKIVNVTLDPGNRILKKATVEKPVDMWKWQLTNAPNMIDRKFAVETLLQVAPSEVEFLRSMFYAETEAFVRLSLVPVMLNDKKNIAAVLQDADYRVRLAGVKQSSGIVKGTLKTYEKLLADSSYSVIIESLHFLARHNPAKLPEYLKRTANVTGDFDHGVHITYLAYRYLISSDNEYAKAILRYTAAQFNVPTRKMAMEALVQVGYVDKQVVTSLINGVLYFNRKLSVPYKSILRNWVSQKQEVRKYTEEILSEKTWPEWQEMKIRRLMQPD